MLLPGFLKAQYVVVGNTEDCMNNISVYSVSGTPVPATYTWNVSGGYIVSTGTGTVSIAWSAVGSGSVGATLYDVSGSVIGTPSLAVTVNPLPQPVLTTDFTNNCIIYKEREGQVIPTVVNDDCWHVCENGTVHYFANPVNVGSVFSWSVTGAQNFTVISNNEIAVLWGSAGNGMVSVTETDANGCVNTIEKCIVIIESPQAIITAYPGDVDCRLGGSITVCLEQNALFFGNADLGNSGSPIVSWLWDFGDGTISTHKDEVHSWLTPGTYQITLTVTNACGCTGICYVAVEVDPVNGVNIECPTPVCQGDTGKYYTDAVNCSSYNWVVSGGNILSPMPYGSSIQVEWTGGNGNGILCLDNTNGGCGNYCPSETCVEIPIISTTSNIVGPALVCIGTQTKYNVPAMTGCVYNWQIAGSNGTIISGQGTNEILVDWSSAGTSTLSVNYTNTLLNCGGTASLTVETKQPFIISGPTKSCPGANVVLTAVNPDNVLLDWTITDASQNTIYVGNGTGVPDFTIAGWTYPSGTYIITALDNTNSYCNYTASITIEITDAPPAPALPVGDNPICPGTVHLYSGTTLNAGYYLEWSTTQGLPATGTGNELSIGWVNTTPPHNYSISLVQVESSTGCKSMPTVLPIQERFYINPVIAGNFTPCINKQVTYQISNAAPLGNYLYDQLEWVIIPSTAGSVISGQGTTSVTVQWNNQPSPSGVYDTYLQVKTSLCGSPPIPYPNTVFDPPNISLGGAPSLAITASPNPACENTAITFTAVPALPGNYTWSFGDGNSGNSPLTTSHSYTLTQGANLTTFDVTLTVDDGGCQSYASTKVDINPAPLYSLTISPLQFCPPTTTNITATLVQQSGSFNYSWSNNTSNNTNINTLNYLDTQPFGITITNTVTGCARIENFSISTCSPNPTPCNPNPINISFTPTPASDCFTVNFSGSINTTPPTPPSSISYLWDFGDNASDNTTLTPSHTYSTAGQYSACLYAYDNTGQQYCDYYCAPIPLALFPDFITSLHCSSTPGSYDVEFIDLSAFISPITSWEWYSGTTLLSTNNHPTVTLAAGSYSIKLKIGNGTKYCERTLTINIPAPPVASFTVTGGPFCEAQTVVQLTASNTNVHHALWNFGDASTFIPQNPAASIDAQRVFEIGFSIYSVNLIVTDNYGCTYTSTQQVTVNDYNLGGYISVIPNTFCPGVNALCSFTAQTGNPTSWLWTGGITTPTLTVSQTGQYFVTVSDNNGCSYSPAAGGQAVVVNVPKPVIRGDLTLCEGDAIDLDGNQGTAVQYNWTVVDPNNVTTTFSQSSIHIAGAVAGTYHVTLDITANGCSRSTSVDVDVNPLPPLPDIQSSVAQSCEGQPIDLTVMNAGTYWVNWSNGASGPVITVYNAGAYQATLTDANGCTNHETFEVHENPYAGFMMTGCVQYCDTLPVTVFGSGNLSFEKWIWYVDGVAQTSGQQSQVQNLNLGLLSPGVYVVTLQLVVTYPDGTHCEMMSDALEITIIPCPCRLYPEGKIYCMNEVNGDVQSLNNYHFEIVTNYSCSANPNVMVTSPDGGVSMLPNSNPPQLLTGILSTYSAYPNNVCFDINITDPNKPECSCNYLYCMKLPKCGVPVGCGIEIKIDNVQCIGHDANGNRIYSFTLTLLNSPQLFSMFTAQGGVLGAMPATVGPGTTIINSSITVSNTASTFCITLHGYNFTTYTACKSSGCSGNLPPCGIPPSRNGEKNTTTPLLRVSYQNDGNNAVQISTLSLMPNPAKNSVTLRYSARTGGIITITSAVGQIVYNEKVATEGLSELSTQSWQPGIYFVTLQSNAGDCLVQKLIIIK